MVIKKKIIAINPARQFASARNAQRWSDINAILNANWQYAVDNNGTLPAAITGTATEICQTGGTCTGLIDLGVLTTAATYLPAIPADPTGSSANGVGYEISITDGRVTVGAPDAELGVTISVTR